MNPEEFKMVSGDHRENRGITGYALLRLGLEVRLRDFDESSFICILPGSAVIYRPIVYVIMYILAEKVHSEMES